jgi:RHS repeat-associated protein
MIRPHSGEPTRHRFAASDCAWVAQATLAECLVIQTTTKIGGERQRAWWQPGRTRSGIDLRRDVRVTWSGALRHDAYGQQVVLTADSVTVRAGSSYGNQVGFTGRYLDVESGLWYFRARMYSGALGRFISRDPLGSPIECGLPLSIASLFKLDVQQLKNCDMRGKSLYCFLNDNPQSNDPLGLGETDVSGSGISNATPSVPLNPPANLGATVDFNIIHDCTADPVSITFGAAVVTGVTSVNIAGQKYTLTARVTGGPVKKVSPCSPGGLSGYQKQCVDIVIDVFGEVENTVPAIQGFGAGVKANVKLGSAPGTVCCPCVCVDPTAAAIDNGL